MDEMDDKVYIIVLNWNNWEDTVVCLESVYRSSYSNYQVIAVDNGSTDGSEEKIIGWANGEVKAALSSAEAITQKTPIPKPIENIKYDRATAEAGGTRVDEISRGMATGSRMPYPMIFIQTGDDLGCAGGNNVAMRYVLQKDEKAFIWMLSNDTVVDVNALSEMVRLFKSTDKIGMAGSKLLYSDNPATLQTAGGGIIHPWAGYTKHIGTNEEDILQWDTPFELDYVVGASILTNADVVRDVGLMSEDYFLYWEDTDWGVRARRKNYRLMYCPKSTVWHKEGGTVGQISPLTDYYFTRNGLIFTRKLYPAFLPIVPFTFFLKYTIIRLLKRQPMNFMAYLKGLWDFLRGRKGE